MTNLTHQWVQLLNQANTRYRSGDALGALEQLKPAIEADVLDGLLLASRI